MLRLGLSLALSPWRRTAPPLSGDAVFSFFRDGVFAVGGATWSETGEVWSEA
jgi:hypothetical protein